jgi:hypothetical protein
MNKYAKIFSLTLMTLLTVKSIAQNTTSVWSETLEKKHLQNREDSTKWDLELFREDLKTQNTMGNTEFPMIYGTFPVPKYDLVGKYGWTGLGSGGYWKNCSDKKIVYSNFNISKNGSNEQFLGDKKNEVFFTIIVLTNFIDSINYTHRSSQIVSRNNPDFVGQGYIKTKDNKVDYTAFITANREQHALVNMRLFNLKNGRFILIAPQTDGSLRSLQLSSPILSTDEIDAYIDKILKKENVIKFFTSKGNI